MRSSQGIGSEQDAKGFLSLCIHPNARLALYVSPLTPLNLSGAKSMTNKSGRIGRSSEAASVAQSFVACGRQESQVTGPSPNLGEIATNGG